MRWLFAPNSWCCILAPFRGSSREEGLRRVALAIEQAVDGLDLEAGNLRILIENTAGSEFSLGGNFEQVAELLYLLSGFVLAGACIDTCHTHAAGYDIVSQDGFAENSRSTRTNDRIEDVYVWHCNDAKAARGSKLDQQSAHWQGIDRTGAIPAPVRRSAPGERPHSSPRHRLMSRSTTLLNVNALKALVGEGRSLPRRKQKPRASSL